MTQKGNVLHSLEELKGVVLVPLPELPDLEELSFENLEAQADKIREGADKIRRWTEAALTQIDQVVGLSREARELTGDTITISQKSLTEFLGHEVPAYRRAACLALLIHEFSRDLHSREEVEELAKRLVEDGRLTEDSQGEVRLYDRNFRISPEARFERPEIAEIRRVVGNLLKRVEAEDKKERGEKVQELKAQADISPQELCDGKPGKGFLSVPPEKAENGFWRGGGTMLVESDGWKIKPLTATGSIEAAMEEAKDLKVHLLVSSLKYETAPRLDLPEEMARKVQLLWHLVKRALRAEEANVVRTAFAEKATISPEEFFVERKPGVCLVEFHRIWETPAGERITNLFLLVERKGKKEPKLQIVKVPDHLNGLFASCMGEKYSEEGSKFEGVAQPLRAVLQAVYGQTSQSAAKTVRINGK
jgi:hypothetical protein